MCISMDVCVLCGDSLQDKKRYEKLAIKTLESSLCITLKNRVFSRNLQATQQTRPFPSQRLAALASTTRIRALKRTALYLSGVFLPCLITSERPLRLQICQIKAQQEFCYADNRSWPDPSQILGAKGRAPDYHSLRAVVVPFGILNDPPFYLINVGMVITPIYSNMAAEQGVLQFKSFQSTLDSGFWNELSKRKLEKYQLNDAPWFLYEQFTLWPSNYH